MRDSKCPDCGGLMVKGSAACWPCSRKRGTIGRPRMPRRKVAWKCCAKCRVMKPASEFTRNGKMLDGLQSWCRECSRVSHRVVSANAYAKRAAFRKQEKDRPCADCGGSFPPECMDFDHVRGRKEFEIGKSNFPVERLAAEIAKCEVVCANCHRIRTKARQQNGRRRKVG